MEIRLSQCTIRSFRSGDEEALVRHANNRKIWRNLRDGFPHPFTREDARRFLERVREAATETTFCIAVESEAVGGVGIKLHEDVERYTAELGYWLAEPFWGRGIMTEVVQAVTRYAMEKHDLRRVFATPYAWNPASHRVLEKAGFVLEGRLRCSAFKDGQDVDQLMYACTLDDLGKR